MKQESVYNAGKNSLSTDILQRRPVVVNAEVRTVAVKAVTLDGCEDVYNMEVEDNHNFAVNGGMIVHNCMDSIRYMVKTMKIAIPKADYRIPW